MAWGGGPAAAAAAATVAADALLDSYELERRPHVRATTQSALSICALIIIRAWPLTRLRDLLLIAGDRFPLTTEWTQGRPAGTNVWVPEWVPNPFRLPTAAERGLFDFRAGAGAAEPGWLARDAAAGAPLPNFAVLELEGAAAAPVRLDDALWRACDAEQQRRAAAGAAASDADARQHPRPLWVLLLAPGASALGAADHPLTRLPPATLAALLSGGDAGGSGGPACVALQLLPASGAPARLAAHARVRHAAAAVVLAAPSSFPADAAACEEAWMPCAHASAADATTALAAWFESMSAVAVLVRPDRFVFGAYSQREFAGAAERVARLYSSPEAPLLLRPRARHLCARARTVLPLAATVALALALALGALWGGSAPTLALQQSQLARLLWSRR